MSRIRPWADLPEGIVELFVNKLHFPDQVRALAVCKGWLSNKNYVTTSDRLPWVVSYEPGLKSEDGEYPVMCKLYDPYTKQVFSKAYRDLNFPRKSVPASRNGWLFLDYGYSCLLHNPFANDKIPLPVDGYITHTTMKAGSKPSECEILTVSLDNSGHYYTYITVERCCFSTDGGYVGDCKSHTFHEPYNYPTCHSMLYLNGNIYFFLETAQWEFELNSYRLEDKSWKHLTEGFPLSFEAWGYFVGCWLVEVNGNLMMVRLDQEDEIYNWVIFRFDWAEMSWVDETGLKSCAIFISGRSAYSAPLTYNEGCKLFYHDRSCFNGSGCRGFKCHSLSEAGVTQVQSHEYEWIHGCREFYFADPPYFGM